MSASELKLISPLGENIKTGPVEIRNFILNRKFLLFAEIGILIYITFDLHGLSKYLGLTGTILYWHLAAFVTILFCALFAWLFARINNLYPKFPPYLPLILFVSMWPAVALNRLIAALLTDVPYPDLFTYIKETSASSVGVLLLGFILFETSRIDALSDSEQNRESDVRPARISQNFITLAGSNISISELVYIKSAGHYLELLTIDGKLDIIYGKLSDLDQKSATELGVSPHRSYWIPKDAILRMKRTGRKTHLQLIGSHEVPVSEARKKAIKEWLLDYIPSALK